MSLLYECDICHTLFRTREKYEECKEMHKSEIIYHIIELKHLFNGKYGFIDCVYRIKSGSKLNDKVSCHSLYGGHPWFSTECLDTPEDVLAAKKRIIQAAINWSDEYNDMLNSLAGELENDAEENTSQMARNSRI